MTASICPCDGASIAAPTNLPQLSHIAYRVGTYADFRTALLTPTPGEQTLSLDGVPVWRTDGAGDLAVMIAEWFAYIADILTFYNERIANQDYLRTADLPESVNHLIAVLGYRPRPAIGATGVLAALVVAGQTATLPKGLQFQSKPLPGQPPQVFELSADTPIGPPDQVPAAPAPKLLGTVTSPRSWSRYAYAYSYRGSYHRSFGGARILEEATAIGGVYRVLLNGAVTTIDPGAHLILRPRDPSAGEPMVVTVQAATVGESAGGGQQTTLRFTLSDTPPDGLTAAQTALEKANQNASLWSFFSGAVSGTTVHLASLVRQIRPGDWLLFTAPSLTPALVQVAATSEAIWDATGSSAHPNTASDPAHPVPIPHTVLTLKSGLSSTWNSSAGSATVQFAWIAAGALLDQPYGAWSGTPATLLATGGQSFPVSLDLPILLQDSNGAGIQATGSSVGDANLALGSLPSPVPSLQPPFAVLPNLLPVTRGKTVANEVLGSGDATNPAQTFKLSQSPVTYLQHGAIWASTIALTVDGQPWSEVPSFYGQPPNATVFVTFEDDSGSTHVQFGDGLNGARLPTGINNVVATYRVGAGAASPPAGKLTVISQSYPGLRAVINPVPVGGGADADPPDQIRRNAPRSVLAFGRAVSVFDYEAIAAQAPGVTRARAVWAWDDARQRTLVTVYVGDDAAAVTSARTVLAASGDPNRPVKVTLATQVPVALTLSLVTTPGMDFNVIAAAVAAALTDTETGLFGSWRLAIGQPLFDSQIEAAVLAVPGAVAITACTFIANGALDPGPLHNPGEGGFYTLAAADFTPIPEPNSNGG
jgi:uncharacterized protein YndB with AHSA1/START domain